MVKLPLMNKSIFRALVFVSHSVGDGARSSRHSTTETLSPPLTSQHSLLRGLALAVVLGGTGPFLAQQRGHLLGISVLHSLQQAVIILVPLICLWGKR